ncbi:MAG: chorismate synthase [Paramuribaculum sp.]|nr:chorismate synthase [Paramuribaculum sp.]
MNSFGQIYRLTTFGESHGIAIGGIIDGVPAGVCLDLEALQQELNRRRPGQSAMTTQRREADIVELLSGIMDGVTTGTPIGFIIRNSDQHSNDYEEMRHKYRPSHADYTYDVKYGVRDHRGGGRSSARETTTRIVAGGIAKQLLAKYGIKIWAYTSAIGETDTPSDYHNYSAEATEQSTVRCPDPIISARMEQAITEAKSEGDTLGGTVTCIINGCPAGLGEPVYGKLQAALAAAMMSINAAKSFEYGMGSEGCRRKGSEVADQMRADDGKTIFMTNNSGGIQGGISNGEDIYFKVGFKPVATLMKKLLTITDSGDNTTIEARGRHDACVVPRAVPVVEAMAAMVILDYLLLNRTARL